MGREVYELGTLCSLFSLNEKDLHKFIVGQGQLCLSHEGDRLLIYIPSMDVYTPYLTDKHRILLSKLESSSFKLNVEGALLSVTSNQHPPFNFLLLSDCHDALQKFIDVDSSVYALVPARMSSPLFVGHRNVINRLAEDMSEEVTVAPLNSMMSLVIPISSPRKGA